MTPFPETVSDPAGLLWMDTFPFPASLRRVLRTTGRLMYRAERRAEKKSKAFGLV